MASAKRKILHSTLTCPQCRHASRERMPEDACTFFHVCAGCGATLRPQPGDCCVFCSYGDVVCPPRQTGAGSLERSTQADA